MWHLVPGPPFFPQGNRILSNLSKQLVQFLGSSYANKPATIFQAKDGREKARAQLRGSFLAVSPQAALWTNHNLTITVTSNQLNIAFEG